MEPFSTGGLKALFSFPFRKAGWERKLLILAGFYLGGLVIPLFPWLFAFGYTAEMIRRAARNDDPELPEWEDWNDILMDGLRFFGVSLFYILPLLVVFGLGFGVYFGTMVGTIGLAERVRPPDWLPMALFTSIGVFFCSLTCGTLLGIGLGLVMPAALTHAAVKRSFGAFFKVGEWWQILRANLGGYVIFFVLLGGALFVWQLVYSLLAWTLVLLPVTIFIPFLAAPYFSAVMAVVFGRIYREGVDNLRLKAAVSDPPADQDMAAGAI